MRALLLGVVCALLVVGAAADGFAVCRFQGSANVNGYFTFQQGSSGADTTVVANFTSASKVKHLYLHIHTYGDLGISVSDNECFTDVTLGPYNAARSPHHFLETSWVTGVNLFGSESVVGRSMALYSKVSSCSAGLNARPLARCVVGLRNVQSTATNEGGLYLDSTPTSAYGVFVGTTGQFGDNSDVTGKIWFIPTEDDLVYVSVKATGLQAYTRHAVHVHVWGDITSRDGMSAGLHLNPYDQIHGYPPSLIRHMGDMGNLTTNHLGCVDFEDAFNLLSLTATVGNILGRAVIIHSLGDDGNPYNLTTSTGAAGGRMARAVVGLSDRLPDSYDADEWRVRLADRVASMKAAVTAAANPSPATTTTTTTPSVARVVVPGALEAL